MQRGKRTIQLNKKKKPALKKTPNLALRSVFSGFLKLLIAHEGPSHRRYNVSKRVYRHIITYKFQLFLSKKHRITGYKERKSDKVALRNGRKKW